MNDDGCYCDFGERPTVQHTERVWDQPDPGDELDAMVDASMSREPAPLMTGDG